MNGHSMSGLDFSIEQSRSCLFGKFQWVERIGSGFWCGELESDSTIESDYILFLYPGRHNSSNHL